MHDYACMHHMVARDQAFDHPDSRQYACTCLLRAHVNVICRKHDESFLGSAQSTILASIYANASMSANCGSLSIILLSKMKPLCAPSVKQ